jgi:signal transduction histidine kinase
VYPDPEWSDRGGGGSGEPARPAGAPATGPGPGRATPGPGEGAEAPPARADHLRFVSHEIRNPLTAALWSAEILARLPADERGGARGEKLARTCLRSLQRLRRLTEDHFLAERLDARGYPIAVEAARVADLLPPDPASAGAARLDADVPSDLVAAVDPVLASRALEGAVLAAAREGGAVRVEARSRRGVVRVRVTGAPPLPGAMRDPGPGTSSEPRGAGLALGTARRAAAATGGALRVEGGSFVLELPEAPGTGSAGP